MEEYLTVNILFPPSHILDGVPLSWCDDLVKRTVGPNGGLRFPLLGSGSKSSLHEYPVDRLLSGGSSGFRSGQHACASCGEATGDWGEGDDIDGIIFNSSYSIDCLFNTVLKLGTGSFSSVTVLQSRLRPTRFFAAKSFTQLPSPIMLLSSVCGREGAMNELHLTPSGVGCAVLNHCPMLCNLLREAQVIATLPPHPRLERFYGVFVEHDPLYGTDCMPTSSPRTVAAPTSVHMVVEVGIGGTFGELLKLYGSYIAEEHLVCWMSQILSGLACLHGNGLLHRDIKPSNILLRNRVSPTNWESNVELILADFGIATKVTDSDSQTERTVVGSCAYLPPEIARYWGYRHRCPYSYASDIWSAAALFYVFLTGGGLGMDEGMLTVTFNGMIPSFMSPTESESNATVAARLWVARGDYPPLATLAVIPLVDDKALQISIRELAARRGCHEESICGEHSVGVDKEDGNIIATDRISGTQYTRYTSLSGDETKEGVTSTTQWPPWVLTPSVQLMARALRARNLSAEFLHCIDRMMAVDPAERPTAKKLLLESPIFSLRMPWWEKSVEASVKRIVEGKEDVLLDVCSGDSDEEEEEDEEEAALLGRTMTPSVLPIDNGRYLPHNVVHWWSVDVSGDMLERRGNAQTTSLLEHILTALGNLRAYDTPVDPIVSVQSTTDHESHRKLPMYMPKTLCFVERVFLQMQEYDIAFQTVGDNGPLLEELEARGLNTNFFIHSQLRLSASARVDKVYLPSLIEDDEDILDEEEAAHCAMEMLVSAVNTWLEDRLDGETDTATACGNTLSPLPWVSWSHNYFAGAGERCFIVEYVSAVPLAIPSPAPPNRITTITGDVHTVFMHWRANLVDAHRRSQHGDATTTDCEDVPYDNHIGDVGPSTTKLEGCMDKWLEALDDAEFRLLHKEEEEIKECAQHWAIPPNRITRWLCVSPVPSPCECAQFMRETLDDGAEIRARVNKLVSDICFRTEGALILQSRPRARAVSQCSSSVYRCSAHRRW